MITDREKYLMLWAANHAEHYLNKEKKYCEDLDEFLLVVGGEYCITDDFKKLLSDKANRRAEEQKAKIIEKGELNV